MEKYWKWICLLLAFASGYLAVDYLRQFLEGSENPMAIVALISFSALTLLWVILFFRSLKH